MKYLLLSTALILTSFGSPEQAPATVERKYNFHAELGKKDHQIISRWTNTEADGSFMLAVEPGCILLKVKEVMFTDQLCRLRIVGSPAGQAMLDYAKNALGIESDLFQIHYVTQKQETGGLKIPHYHKIIKIEDVK